MIERTINDVVDTLQRARENSIGCTLLIGSGCSVTAGIPTAEGFVREIEKGFPLHYQRATNKTYFDCMSQFSRGERRDLIASYINKANINWAHMSIAQLMKSGFIDRVLTTNFDPLVVRACALLNLFPAVYDVTSSENFNPALISDPSIFYLHGQHTGFVLINTPQEFEENSRRIAPVFNEAVRKRVWVVVGYSGDNDPVFDCLAHVDRFDYNLYWVGYFNNPPLPVVRERLLAVDKDAFYIKGFNADDFFVRLAHKLNCFPPDFVSRPFSYLSDLLGPLTTYSFPKDKEITRPVEVSSHQDENISVSETANATTPSQSNTLDVMEPTRLMIRRAISEIERLNQSADRLPLTEQGMAVERHALSLLMAGEYDRVIDLRPEYDANPQPQLASHIAWAYVMQGTALAEQAIDNSGAQADDLYAHAYRNFQAALEIKPDFKEGFNNHGVALYLQAENKRGIEADKLFVLAYEKFSDALELDPYAYDSLKNWGDALSSQAETRSGIEADRLFDEAYQKYQLSAALAPDQAETFFSWGNALFQQAKTKSADEAYRLCGLAGEKYQAALKADPTHHKTLHNWGTVLSHQAEMKDGREADSLFEMTYRVFQTALRVKPDKHETLENWANALSKHAKKKMGEEADRLYESAYQMYVAAIEIRPSNARVLNHWGIVLTEHAQTKRDEAADRLFEQAYEKFAAALSFKPHMPEALYSWGVALFRQAVTKREEVADELYSKCYEKLEAALKIKPDLYSAIFNWGSAALEQALTKQGVEADRLFSVANEKFHAALQINPAMDQAPAMLGAALFEQAKRKTDKEADELLALAYEYFDQALHLKPEYPGVLSNWGTALATQAKMKSGEMSNSLYVQAYEKFRRAIEVEPTSPETLYNWGATLLEQAKTKTGDEMEYLYEQGCAKLREALHLSPDYYFAHISYGTARLLQVGNRIGGDIYALLLEAEEHLLRAESIQPGDGAYNLACVYARLGNEAACREWLERTRELGKLPSREYVKNDPDLENIKDSQWFKDFLQA